jgi:L-aminopeptidase/D-esterase-like protein
VGHAEFAEGALASILSGESGQDLTKQAVQKGIGAAKAMGLIGPESGARCLMLPAHHFQKSGLGSASCRMHSLRTAA